MNTVLKGDKYENECYILVNRLIDNLELPVVPSSCRVFQKKGYYSKDRDDEIIFDISIEVWPKDAPNYTFLILVECKGYEKSVPVDDIEEFYSKATQVGGLNMKGVFISKSGFQSGSFRYARSKGMMIIQANNSLTSNIILYKADRFKEKTSSIKIENNNSLTEYFEDPLVRVYVHQKWLRIIEQKLILSFVFHLKVSIESKEESIPILKRRDIDEFVNELLYSYDDNIANLGHRINWTEFKKFLSKVFSLNILTSDELGQDDNGRHILSLCSFVDKTIEVHKSIEGTSRYTFMLAHEIGHYFLHNKVVISQHSYDNFSDSEYTFSLDKHKISNQRGWIEWQANAFASSLILPQESLLFKLFSIQERIGINPGKHIYLDNQKCNIDDLHSIITELSIYFSTTKSSVIYRLKDMGFLKIGPEYMGRSIGQIIREVYPGIYD